MGKVSVFLILGGFYMLAYFQAFVFNKPLTSKSTSLTKYEVLRIYSRIFRLVSLVFLAIILVVHYAIYHGVLWAEQMFYFLLWIQDSDPTDDDDPYIDQVALITFFTLLPYAKYSFGIVKRFKKQLFDYLIKKYSVNLKIIDNQSFFTKKLNKTHISHYPLTSKEFRDLIIDSRYPDPEPDGLLKIFKRKKGIFRHGSHIYVDDVLFFPDKKVYMTECEISGYQEEFIEHEDGNYWQKTRDLKDFSGLLLIIQKEKKDENFPKKTIKFYKVNNDTVVLKSDKKRKKIKHDFILNFFYRYFGQNKNVLFNSSRKFADSEDLKVKSLRYGNLENLGYLDNLEDYTNINRDLAKIAEEFNVSFVMEDSSRIYLFHQERFVDFFTFYQHRSTKVSAAAFEDDFKLMLDIVNRL